MRLSSLLEAKKPTNIQNAVGLFNQIKQFFFTNSKTFPRDSQNINKIYYCMNNIFMLLRRWEQSEGAWPRSLQSLRSIDQQKFNQAQIEFNQYRMKYIQDVANLLNEIANIKFTNDIERKFKYGIYKTVYYCVFYMMQYMPVFGKNAKKYTDQLQTLTRKP